MTTVLESKPARKLFPAEMGYQRPFSLSYSGGVSFDSPEDGKRVTEYIAHVLSLGKKVYKFMCDLEASSLEGSILVHLMVMPSRVKQEVADSTVWREVVSPELYPLDPSLENDWAGIQAGASLVYFFRTLCGQEGKPSAAGKALHEVVTKYALDTRRFTPELFSKLFGGFGSATVLGRLCTRISGSVSALLSQRENARIESRERAATLHNLEAEYPLFFKSFAAFYSDVQAQAMQDRALTGIRREISKELLVAGLTQQEANKLIRACQMRAVAARKDLPTWQVTRAIDEEMELLADSAQECVDRIAKAIPSTLEKSFVDDRFRRFASAHIKKAKGLSRDIGLINKIVGIYQDAFSPFTEQESKDFFANIGSRGPVKFHAGWEQLCESKVKAHKELVKFVTTKVKDFCLCMRPVQQSKELTEPDFWPKFQNDVYGWVEDASPAAEVGPLPANAVRIVLHVPNYKEGVAARNVALRIRGNLPGVRAQKQPQIDVMMPGIQFRPDRSISIAHSSRKLLLKHQALSLRIEGEGEESKLVFSLATTAMAEVAAPAKDRLNEEHEKRQANKAAGIKAGKREGPPPVAVGERIAVLHVQPGGLRVASLVVFEKLGSPVTTPEAVAKSLSAGLTAIPKNCTQWKQVTLSESVARTDIGAYGHADSGKRCRIFNRTQKQSAFLTFEADSLDRKYEAWTEQPKGAGYIPQSANELHMATSGQKRTDGGSVFYKTIAGRIARVCAAHNVTQVLIVMGAGLRGKSQVAHPVRSFLTVMNMELSGYLHTALSKVGAAIHYMTIRATKIISREYIRTLDISTLALGAGYHVETESIQGIATSIASTKGKKDRIDAANMVENGKLSPTGTSFVINGAWSSLLYWQDSEFAEAVQRLTPAEAE